MDNWTVSDVTDMLVLLDRILQMQLFQINQSEDSSKITIMSDTTCVQLHQRPITSASNYISVQLQPHLLYVVHKYEYEYLQRQVSILSKAYQVMGVVYGLWEPDVSPSIATWKTIHPQAQQ